MRPLFLQRAPHPVRSRFSAFPFSLSKASRGGSVRLSGRDDNDHPHHNLSGKTLTTFPSAAWKSGPDRSCQDGDDDEDPAVEPWGLNIGARPTTRSQPWGQNIGAGWELDIMPASAVLGTGTGPRTDGRVERWARHPPNLAF